MMTVQVRGQSHTQQINLIGIDRETYATVSDFSQYLIHPSNRDGIEFNLRDGGYETNRPALLGSGWEHRRQKSRLEKQLRAEQAEAAQLRRRVQEATTVQTADSNINESEPTSEASSIEASGPSAGPTFAQSTSSAHEFDPETETHTGVVLGVGLGSFRTRDEEGKVIDYHYLVPGDDVSIALPNAGSPPRALDEVFTVVDFYESQMSEYDSTFAFMPLEKLQQIRGMIEPISGNRSVSSIQVKLAEGTDLAAARDQLQALFPPETTMVQVSTWRDSQGPLLAAVQMETTILNILLFLIIAVAGFGILATFFMIVVEKTRDIGILKSLGASGHSVAGIFLLYGLLLGFAGSGVGAVIGLLFVYYINDIAALLEKVTGQEVFDPTVYYFTKIPTIVHPAMLVWVVIGAVAIALLASVLPSIRAARMHPVEALRYE
jgi:lipoprotein-releasing system permease protein